VATPLREAFGFRKPNAPAAGCAPLTNFCGDLLYHLDLEVALRNDFLQPHVLLLECLQPSNLVRV
jgi:hypothetical protein